jgi:hypothetical protein
MTPTPPNIRHIPVPRCAYPGRLHKPAADLLGYLTWTCHRGCIALWRPPRHFHRRHQTPTIISEHWPINNTCIWHADACDSHACLSATPYTDPITPTLPSRSIPRPSRRPSDHCHHPQLVHASRPHFNCRRLLGRVHPDSPQRPLTVSTATAMAPPRLGIGTDAGIRMRQQELVWAQCCRWLLGTCLWHLTGACCKLAHVALPVACEPNNQYTNTQSRLALRAMVFQTDIPTPAMTWEGPARSHGRS